VLSGRAAEHAARIILAEQMPDADVRDFGKAVGPLVPDVVVINGPTTYVEVKSLNEKGDLVIRKDQHANILASTDPFWYALLFHPPGIFDREPHEYIETLLATSELLLVKDPRVVAWIVEEHASTLESKQGVARRRRGWEAYEWWRMSAARFKEMVAGNSISMRHSSYGQTAKEQGPSTQVDKSAF